MAERKNDERRDYLRVDLTTRVRLQPVSRQEFEQHKTTQTGSASDGLYREESNGPGTQFGPLLQRLVRIEEKVDRILGKLDPECKPDEAVAYGTAQNVSGSGISLFLDEAMKVGQLVQISLSVPGFSIGFLHAYGEIVRVIPTKNRGENSFNTSIKFLDINETERDKLISYAFYRKRQEIRNLSIAKEKTGDIG